MSPALLALLAAVAPTLLAAAEPTELGTAGGGALAGDDECAWSPDGPGCSFSALQLRGQRLATAASDKSSTETESDSLAEGIGGEVLGGAADLDEAKGASGDSAAGSEDAEVQGDARSSRRPYSSPRRRYSSPRRRYSSPRRRYSSPRRRYSSPRRRRSAASSLLRRRYVSVRRRRTHVVHHVHVIHHGGYYGGYAYGDGDDDLAGHPHTVCIRRRRQECGKCPGKACGGHHCDDDCQTCSSSMFSLGQRRRGCRRRWNMDRGRRRTR